VPLLENATLEDDDDLQDVWAKLLVNSADASSGIEPRRAFGSVLAEMSLLDVRNLAQIESATKLFEDDPFWAVWTYEPERAISQALPTGDEPDPSPAVQISLSNLVRLGCIVPTDKELSTPTNKLVNLTPFGLALIEACTR
jgi:hypothetical protein